MKNFNILHLQTISTFLWTKSFLLYLFNELLQLNLLSASCSPVHVSPQQS